ncbi:MAG: sugar phosphate nucleotidyltransferase [bacterium]|nr:sugar phosphate nucleotidyltransferase [bacterium]
MKAIIPAAGIGKRLRPHTYSLPKALLYVAGRPIISHILDEVTKLKVSSVALIVGYKGDMIEAYVRGEYPNVKVDFVYQNERKGIGHAINMTRDVADEGEPLLIILGDTIIQTDLAKIVQSEHNALGVKEVEDPRRFGVAEVGGGLITKLVEKPKNPASNLALVGLYYLSDSSLLFEMLKEQIEKDIRHHGEYQVTDALQMMIDRGASFSPFGIDEWFDCGNADALLETNRKLLEERESAGPVDGSTIIAPSAVDPTATIVNSTIGPHVSIAAGATVSGSTIRDSVIDRGARVENSVLAGSIIGAEAVVIGASGKLNIGDSSEVVVT